MIENDKQLFLTDEQEQVAKEIVTDLITKFAPSFGGSLEPSISINYKLDNQDKRCVLQIEDSAHSNTLRNQHALIGIAGILIGVGHSKHDKSITRIPDVASAHHGNGFVNITFANIEDMKLFLVSAASTQEQKLVLTGAGLEK